MHRVYQILHSIRGQVTEFSSRVHLIGYYDIIILTEIWLNNDVENGLLGMHGYRIFCCDGNNFNSSKKLEGRVLDTVWPSVFYLMAHT